MAFGNIGPITYEKPAGAVHSDDTASAPAGFQRFVSDVARMVMNALRPTPVASLLLGPLWQSPISLSTSLAILRALPSVQPLFEKRQQGPDSYGLASRRSTGTVPHVEAQDVEMSPRRSPLDKMFEK